MSKKKNKEKDNKIQQAKQKEIEKYFKSIPFQYVTIDNHETICYRIFGKPKNNKVIVFLHGNMSGQRHWDPLFPYLLQDDKFTYVTIDLRGFGRSSYLNRVETLEDFANDLKKVFEELDLNKFILVGNSLGGGIAMQYAIKYPQEVQKLVLVGSIHHEGYPPFLEKDNETQQMERIQDIHTIEDKSKRINKNILEKDLDFLKIFFGSTLVKSKKQWFSSDKQMNIIFKETFLQRNYTDSITAQHFFDISESIHMINCPVLIYHGDTDVLIPLEKAKDNASTLKRFVGRENCVLIIKKECGHAVIFEYPKDFSRTLLTFAKLTFKQPKPRF